MEYLEITLHIVPYNEITAEILIAELGEAGCDSFVDTDDGFSAYIQKKSFIKARIDEAFVNTCFAEKVSYVIKEVAPQNWNAVWESNFEPVIIGNHCTIRAPFHQNLPKTEIDLVIEPKMAFGTGHHETTYLMAEYILQNDLAGMRVLDMGCGTGILAMLAALKGAEYVDAIDNDEWATDNAADNIEKNGLTPLITVLTGDASLLKECCYNIILANINRNILLNDMRHYVKSLLPGGKLIMSGIYVDDIPLIEEEATELALIINTEKSLRKWAVVEFLKHNN